MTSSLLHHHHASSPLIKHLHGVLMSVHAEAPYGYTLGFHLTPNAYFTNTDDNDALSYDDITKQSFDNIYIFAQAANGCQFVANTSNPAELSVRTMACGATPLTVMCKNPSSLATAFCIVGIRNNN